MQRVVLVLFVAAIAWAADSGRPTASSECGPVISFPIIVRENDACFHLDRNIEWHGFGPMVEWRGARGELQFRGFKITAINQCSGGIIVAGDEASLTVFDLNLLGTGSSCFAHVGALAVLGGSMTLYDARVEAFSIAVAAAVETTMNAQRLTVINAFQGFICSRSAECTLQESGIYDTFVGVRTGGVGGRISDVNIFNTVLGLIVNATGPQAIDNVRVSGAAWVLVTVNDAPNVLFTNLQTSDLIGFGGESVHIEVTGASQLLLNNWKASGGAAGLLVEFGTSGQVTVAESDLTTIYWGIYMDDDSASVVVRDTTIAETCYGVFTAPSGGPLILRNNEFSLNSQATWLQAPALVTTGNLNTGDTGDYCGPDPLF
jgi:hypothetical protein